MTNTFSFGTTTGSTGSTGTPQFNFGGPPKNTGTQTTSSTFALPNTATNFGFPKTQGTTSPTQASVFSFGGTGMNLGGNAGAQQNAAKPPTFGGFTVPSNLTTSGALPKSGNSAFTMNSSGTSGTTTAPPSFGTQSTTTTSFTTGGTSTTTQATGMSFGILGGNKGTTTTNGSSTTPTTTGTQLNFATTTTTSTAVNPGFAFPNKTTTTGSSTTPTTTGTQLNFGTAITSTTGTIGTNAPPLVFGTGAGTSTTSTSTTTTTTTTSTTTSTSTVPTVSNADVQAILKGKSLDSILNSWGNEINSQADAFMQQAHKVAEWDTELLKNKEKLTRLKDHLDSTSFAQDNLDRKLELIKEKQNDVNSVLKELEDGLEKMQTEQNVIDISKADKDRKKGYKLAEDINSQIDVIQGTLEELVTTLNEKRAVGSAQEEKPEAKIMAILNDHLITLQWIDQATLDLDLKVKEIEKSYRTYL